MIVNIPPSLAWLLLAIFQRNAAQLTCLLGNIHFYRTVESEVDDQEHVCGLFITLHAEKLQSQKGSTHIIYKMKNPLLIF